MIPYKCSMEPFIGSGKAKVKLKMSGQGEVDLGPRTIWRRPFRMRARIFPTSNLNSMYMAHKECILNSTLALYICCLLFDCSYSTMEKDMRRHFASFRYVL